MIRFGGEVRVPSGRAEVRRREIAVAVSARVPWTFEVLAERRAAQPTTGRHWACWRALVGRRRWNAPAEGDDRDDRRAAQELLPVMLHTTPLLVPARCRPRAHRPRPPCSPAIQPNASSGRAPLAVCSSRVNATEGAAALTRSGTTNVRPDFGAGWPASARSPGEAQYPGGYRAGPGSRPRKTAGGDGVPPKAEDERAA